MTDHTARLYQGAAALAIGCLLGASPGPAAAQEPHPEEGDPATALRVEVDGVVEAPFGEVRAVLLDLESFGRWFPALAEWQVLSRAGTSARVHGRQDLPWPVADRDYVVLYRWWEEADGAFVLEAVAQLGAPPAPRSGVVRLEALRTEWRLEADGERTRARYLYEGEPGGTLPDWVARVGWRAHTGRVMEGLGREVEARRGR